MKLLLWQKKIIKRLDDLFLTATKENQITAAVQCLKTMASLYSEFTKSSDLENIKSSSQISLKDLSEENLKNLIEESSKKLKKTTSKI